MGNYLQNLATDILRLEKKGITKVRFAKYIYFVHKFLAKKSLVQTQDLKFIRMPLGPVPVGFRDLDGNKNIVRTSVPQALIYDSEVYKLADGVNLSTGFSEEIKNIVETLDNYPTSALVSISHKEPSWQTHDNGDEYYITDEDFKKELPGVTKKVDPLDKEKMQASLVSGMLKDIVDESTSLEYPKK